ncbi:MAG: Minf_1886 family protein [Limisphaerales bacterium]
MHEINFEEVLEKIVTRDARYHSDAYFFLREALDHTQKMICNANKNQVRHVSGQELLSGIREYALKQFGPMSLTVLEEWGIRSPEDFGNIVFNMVESNLLAKTEKDTREDFKTGYDFVETFRKPFLPLKKTKMPGTAEPIQIHSTRGTNNR